MERRAGSMCQMPAGYRPEASISRRFSISTKSTYDSRGVGFDVGACYGNRKANVFLPELQRALSGRQSRSWTRNEQSANYMSSLRRSAAAPRRQVRLEIFHAATGRAHPKVEACKLGRF
jgi:hypothetical protein